MSKFSQFDCGLLIIWFACVPINVLSAIFFPKTWGYYFSDMDSADTFRRPTIFGFGSMQNNPQASGGVYLAYPPPHRQLPPMPHFRPNMYNQEPEPAKPAQWSPLVANEKNEQVASTAGPPVPNVAEQQIAPNPHLRPPFLYPQMLPNGYPNRPMIPYRQIPEPQPNEDNSGSEQSAPPESLEDERISEAGLSNWVLGTISLVMIILASIGIAGYFVWRKRFGSSNINAETGPSAGTTPTAT